MDIIAYVVSCLAILWAFAGGQMDVFWTRIFIAAPICLAVALLILKKRKELPILKPNSGSWMMGVGAAFALALSGLLLTWVLKSHNQDIVELSNFKIPGLLVWVLVLGPACEIIYRKFLAPSWGIKSSAFVEALNFGVGAVNFYLFCVVFLWGYVSSKYVMRFGLVAAIFARSVATLLLFLCLKLMA